MNPVLATIVVGAGATLAIDLWAAMLGIFNITSLDYRFIGRWIGYFPKGIFFHDNIIKTPPAPHEALFGWMAHYFIGVGFAFLLVGVYGTGWLEEPSLPPAIMVGFITTAAPLFIMQPALGFGIGSAKLPDANLRRLKSLLTHLVYGVGLYLTAILVQELT